MKILLDSTYLLPMVGIDVKGIEPVLRVLKNLRDKGLAEYYYTQYNILEILGKISRVKYDRDRVMIGLRAIEENFTQINPGVEGWLKALELRSRGFRDTIDLLLYATASMHGLKLLTRDTQLIEFLRGVGEDVGVTIHEEEFVKAYGK